MTPQTTIDVDEAGRPFVLTASTLYVRTGGNMENVGDDQSVGEPPWALVVIIFPHGHLEVAQVPCAVAQQQWVCIGWEGVVQMDMDGMDGWVGGR